MPDPNQPQLPLRETPGSVLKEVHKFLDDLKRTFPEIYEDEPKQSPSIAPPAPAQTSQGSFFPEGDLAKARALIAARVEHFSRIIEVRCRRICIKDQRTLWGSCSGKGQLNFSWRLVLAPAAVLDYVVIHELCHLKEMNHSKKFWHLVNGFCPDHKAQRRWLRANSELLRSACPVGAPPPAPSLPPA
jgi:predicted metal-dependent hydrolase